jgi:hypothetical protein
MLSINLMDDEPPATGGGGSVARDTTVRLRGYGIYSTANGSVNFGTNIPGVQNNLDLESTLGFQPGAAAAFGPELRRLLRLQRE